MSKLSYSEIRDAIKEAPMTWLPALFTVTVEQCIAKKVFQPGGMTRHIDKIERANSQGDASKTAATPNKS
jgi:hypothetical protein